MRELIHVPVVHSIEISLISFLDVSPELKEAISTEAAKYPQLWDEIVRGIARFNLRKPARVYYDSYFGEQMTLPPGFLSSTNEPHEDLPIDFLPVHILATKGKRVIVETTEDEELWGAYKKEVLAIFNLASTPLDPDGDTTKDIPDEIWLPFITAIRGHIDERNKLNIERDQSVAQRIADTLTPEEIGFLFMGGSHDVVSKLPSDIHVRPLNKRLAEKVISIADMIKTTERRYLSTLYAL